MDQHGDQPVTFQRSIQLMGLGPDALNHILDHVSCSLPQQRKLVIRYKASAQICLVEIVASSLQTILRSRSAPSLSCTRHPHQFVRGWSSL